jgi:hypothetical protein
MSKNRMNGEEGMSAFMPPPGRKGGGKGRLAASPPIYYEYIHCTSVCHISKGDNIQIIDGMALKRATHEIKTSFASHHTAITQ